MLRPHGLDPEFFIRQGVADKKQEDQMLRLGGENTAALELGYETGALAHFDRWGPWDAQRVGGRFHGEYVDYATVAIGLYAAANGISRDAILRAENLRAITSGFGKAAHHDPIYKNPLTRNVANTDLGFELFKSYSQYLRNEP